MALSYNEYAADGVQTQYTSPPYLDPSHIQVSVGGTVIASSNYTLTGTSLTFNNAPVIGTVIRIARKTSQDQRLTNYEDASLLTADVMDADANQLFYMAQEAIDTASETNVASNTFYSSSATPPDTATLGDLWYDAANKYLKIYNGTEWDLATPSNETLTYESDVFNDTEANLTYINVANLNLDIFVFLNGVKQVKADSKANLTAPTDSKDFFVDLDNNRVYFARLSTNDVVQIILAASDIGTNNHTQLETYTATANQTLFTLTNSYIPTTNTLSVYVNGVRQSAYTETNATTVTFTNGLTAGDEVTFITNQYQVSQGFTSAENVTYTPVGSSSATTVKNLLDNTALNPNLLINGDFSISQRGTSNTGGGYLVDRWRLREAWRTGGTSSQVHTSGWSNGSKGMSANSGSGFYLAHTATNHTSECYIVQNIELTKDLTLWSQKDFTAAVEFKFDNEVEMKAQLSLIDSSDSANNLLIATSNWEVVGTGNQTKIFNLTTSDLSSLSWTPDPSEDYIQLYIYYRDKNFHAGVPDGDYRFHNVKLEEGSNFTGWPHVDPATELAKCQRYYYQHDGSSLYSCDYANGTTRMLTVPLPVTMRATPAVTATLYGSGWVTTNPYDIYPGKSYCQLNGKATSTNMGSTRLGYFSADAEL